MQNCVCSIYVHVLDFKPAKTNGMIKNNYTIMMNTYTYISIFIKSQHFMIEHQREREREKQTFKIW